MCHCLQLHVNNNNCFVYYSSVYNLCLNNNNYWRIMRQIFVMEIFKPCLLSSNTLPLHTRLTELLLTYLPALLCFIYGRMNVLESEYSWFRLLEISVNVNNDFYIYYCTVVCVFCLHLFIWFCCCSFVYLFTIFYAVCCCRIFSICLFALFL